MVHKNQSIMGIKYMTKITFKNKSISFIKFLFISSLLIFISGCTISSKTKTDSAKNPAAVSEKLNAYFYIGGFRGGYHVKIENNIIKYADTNNRKKINWKSRKITTNEIANLEKAFIQYGVTNWNQKYINLFMKDGTKWGIKYKSNKFDIKSRGSNSYPANFKKLIKYISEELLNGKKFQ